ncbi:hypothetical protein [Epilithonimonas arachidiradicis]|uniref:Uncharacterized protein n=1 Tax=Epilithonimonas arachidiradicis TaxID=1617282 RepID=A0A420CN23_9FLAO|nr:hypothetical protein [Epilithonimonas arachidiradicis]RKE79803.1 hypothetical protein BXY58_3176 [Epilithonimonas arachidiradicis]GGG51644.1 hypothetical protein GCM10007332_11630 [Epilithonimonas arachidiradicis]
MTNTEKQMQEIEETFKSIEKTTASLEKTAYDGTRDILRYFDRIHDKLFTFNNIMIVGFFTISKMKEGVPIELILVPLLNLCFLMYIEFRMMEKSRFEANILEKSKTQIEEQGKQIRKSTNYSLLSIFTTFVVTCFFLYNLFRQ